MEIQKHSRETSSPNETSGHRFEEQLKDVIIRHVDMLSQDGKEKLLDFINALIDIEEKRQEFDRRQGLLYTLGGR